MSFEKLYMKTINFTDENIKKLAEIFPNVVSEDENGKIIDFEALKQELSGNIVEGYKERYSLNWPGKREAQLKANTPTTKTLRPCIEDSVNFDTTENLYIEGDNLEVLKILQEGYLNKIKMIYIDPPYNTGKDFVYKDNFTRDSDEELIESGQINEEGGKLVANLETNGRYHSDWLSMMYPRLKLARNLLKDDGVIFISIDDNEVHNLRKICDEIFGEDNIKSIAVKMSEASGLKMASVIKTGSIPKLKEYVLVIKNDGIKNLSFDKVPKGQWDNEYNIFLSNFTKEDRELINTIRLKDNILETDLILIDEIANKIDLKSVSEVLKEKNMNKNEKDEWLFDNAWKIVRTTASDSVHSLAKDKKQYCSNDLFFVKSSTGLIYFVKATFSEDSKKPRLQLIFADDNLEVHPGDFWTHIKTTGLDNEGEVPYKNGKKPLSLLKSLIKSNVGKDKDSIILDFFSGSASTAHAVMQLNNDENYSLKFIMTQLDENLDDTILKVNGDTRKDIQETINFLNSIKKPHILTELGKERIRRAGKRIVEESGKTDLDIGFRVLKLDSSNMKDIYFNPSEISQQNLFDTVDNIKEDRSDLDLLFGVLIDWGVDLTLPITKEIIAGKDCYFVDSDSLCAYFGDDINEDFIKELAKKEALRFVFKDSSFGNSDDLKDNVSQIFKQLNPQAQIKVI